MRNELQLVRDLIEGTELIVRTARHIGRARAGSGGTRWCWLVRPMWLVRPLCVLVNLGQWFIIANQRIYWLYAPDEHPRIDLALRSMIAHFLDLLSPRDYVVLLTYCSISFVPFCHQDSNINKVYQTQYVQKER
jgi:hypothetical protein